MKLLVALSAFAAVSVAGAGYFTATSNTETGKELRSLIGMEECEGGTCSDEKECLPITEECGLDAPCPSEAKPDCGSSCDEEKPQDEFPT